MSRDPRAFATLHAAQRLNTGSSSHRAGGLPQGAGDAGDRTMELHHLISLSASSVCTGALALGVAQGLPVTGGDRGGDAGGDRTGELRGMWPWSSGRRGDGGAKAVPGAIALERAALPTGRGPAAGALPRVVQSLGSPRTTEMAIAPGPKLEHFLSH